MNQDRRRKWTAAEKLRIVMAGMQAEVDVAELCRREGISPTQYYGWRKQLLSSASKVFANSGKTKQPGVEARNGAYLASASEDTTVLVWDVSGASEKKPALEGSPVRTNLETLWADLSSEDAPKAYRAMGELISKPQGSVALLKQQLKPVAPIEAKWMEQLIADLDNDEFSARKNASEQLQRLGELAEQQLRKALDGKPSPEQRERVGVLLQRLETRTLTGDQLREQRCIEVLERLASSEARALLGDLAKGQPRVPITEDAKAAVKRLAKR